jgi:DNA-3-methyladenine glycosylase I
VDLTSWLVSLETDILHRLINQTMKKRCQWAKDEPNITYHDKEWGRPQHDDQKLFEFLILEGAQAGLSWTTILKRRKGYGVAFSGFDVEIKNT